jgi:hypothetical protein
MNAQATDTMPLDGALPAHASLLIKFVTKELLKAPIFEKLEPFARHFRTVEGITQTSCHHWVWPFCAYTSAQRETTARPTWAACRCHTG